MYLPPPRPACGGSLPSSSQRRRRRRNARAANPADHFLTCSTVFTSAVSPENTHERTGSPSRVTASPTTICGASSRPFFAWPRLRSAGERLALQDPRPPHRPRSAARWCRRRSGPRRRSSGPPSRSRRTSPHWPCSPRGSPWHGRGAGGPVAQALGRKTSSRSHCSQQYSLEYGSSARLATIANSARSNGWSCRPPSRTGRAPCRCPAPPDVFEHVDAAVWPTSRMRCRPLGGRAVRSILAHPQDARRQPAQGFSPSTWSARPKL